MEKDEVKKVVEVLLFLTNRPLSVKEIKRIFKEEKNEVDEKTILSTIFEIMDEYKNRGSPLELREIAGGFQFASKPYYSKYVKGLFKEETTFKLTKPALETLAIITYKQPVTRAEIEEIRGVDSTGVLEGLIEKGLIAVIGRKESIGRPLIYGTTKQFLRHFGLKDITDIPPIEGINKQDGSS